MKNIFTTLIIIWASISTGFSQSNEFISLQSMSEEKPINLNLAMSDPDPIGDGKGNWKLSLAMPGFGLYNVNGNKKSLLLMPACYGLVGVGIITSFIGNIEHRNYLNARDPALIDSHLSKSIMLNTAGLFMVGSGATLWILQVGWTYIYGSYNDIYRERNNNWTDKISLSNGGYNPSTKTFSLTTSIKL